MLRQSHVHVLACTSLNRQVSTYLLPGAERVRALSINLLPALSYGVIQLYIETGNSISGQSFTSLATTKGWLLPCQRHGQCHQDVAKESGLTGEITVVLALCVSTTPPSEEPPWNNQRLEQLKSKLVWSRGSDMECRIHIQRPVLERNKKQSTHKGSRVSFIIFFHLDSAGMFTTSSESFGLADPLPKVVLANDRFAASRNKKISSVQKRMLDLYLYTSHLDENSYPRDSSWLMTS